MRRLLLGLAVALASLTGSLTMIGPSGAASSEPARVTATSTTSATSNPCQPAAGGCWSVFSVSDSASGKPHVLGVTDNAPSSFKLWYQTLSNQDPVVIAARQTTADRGAESGDSAVTANISGTACGAVSECWGWFTPPGIGTHGGNGCSNVFFLIDTYTAPGVKASTMATWQRWCAINTYADWEGYVNGGLNTHNAGFSSINGFFHEKVHPYFCCGYPYTGYGRRSFHDYAQGTVELCIDPPILPPYCIRHSPKISSYLHGDGSVYYHMWAK